MSSMQTPHPVASRVVAPDPSITSAIGRHHTLVTAVADLVDNSIDAGARHVLVRFLVRGEIPVGLQVVDDGSGMDSAGIDQAMTYAAKREYRGEDLGHFGIGLKAASLSQANTLLVWSRPYGSPPVGRRLRKETIDTGPVVEEFAGSDAAERLSALDPGFEMETGTLVEWQDVQTFLTSSSDAEQRAWTNSTTQKLLTHLGLVLHRILDRGELIVEVENHDVWLDFAGARRTVIPIDPFAYRGMARANYPRALPITLSDAEGLAQLHVLPQHDRGPGIVQGGRSDVETQGLYVYRNDRLLQAGGWNGLGTPEPEMRFARIAFDLSPAMENHVTINPEKVGTAFDDELRGAFQRARAADGTTLASFRDDARRAAKLAKQRVASPIAAPLPGAGLPDTVKTAFGTNTEPNDALPVDIKWSLMPEDVVYDVDIEAHKLILNARHRAAIVGRRSLDMDDAPIVKSLLLLLLEDHFVGTGSGAKKRREDAAWQAILLAAIRAQTAHEREGRS